MPVFNHNARIISHSVIPEESKLFYFQCVEIPPERQSLDKADVVVLAGDVNLGTKGVERTKN